MSASNAELLALAERVEAATGADRELDARIHCVIGGREYPEGKPFEWVMDSDECPAFQHITYAGLLQQTARDKAPTYTASLDAAMTLVPENPYNTGERFQVESWTTNGVHAGHVRASAWVSGTRRVFAATPALALTAAALRARATQETNDAE